MQRVNAGRINILCKITPVFSQDINQNEFDQQWIIIRALTRILKTGVQDSHLAKSRSPTGKSGSPTPKSWSPTNLCIPYIFSILAGSDTFD